MSKNDSMLRLAGIHWALRNVQYGKKDGKIDIYLSHILGEWEKEYDCASGIQDNFSSHPYSKLPSYTIARSALNPETYPVPLLFQSEGPLRRSDVRCLAWRYGSGSDIVGS